ncbi:MAG: rod shape-determining protein MreC [Kiritimatiellaeota bacterium]|nr:rod shape-determining protein MreC [Kiritimatiellota bacterium]
MKQSKLKIGFVLVSVGAMLFLHSGVRTFAREAVYPFSNAWVWLDRKVGVRARAAFSRASEAARNARLEHDLARLRLAAEEARALEAEVARLRGLLEYAPPVRARWTAAAVVSRGGTSAVRQTIHAGKGSLHGVRKGDLVLAQEGLVGRVSDVAPHTCEVLLVTDLNSRVACELDLPADEGVGTVRGILSGGGVARPGADARLALLYVVEPLRLRYMAREFEPAPRTRVMTSGLGGAFPRGLTAGYVLGSALEANGLSREAEVIPAVDFAALRDVFILSGGGAQ